MGRDAPCQVCCQLHVRFPRASKSWQLQIVSITFCQFSNGLLISWHWYCLSFFKFIKGGKKTVWRKFGFLQLEGTMTPLKVMALIDLAFKKWKLLEGEIHQVYMDLSTGKLFSIISYSHSCVSLNNGWRVWGTPQPLVRCLSLVCVRGCLIRKTDT